MKQLTQQLKSGTMEILEVPFPALNEGCILVRTRYSVISAGTEGKTVIDARKGYLSKALSRKKEVKQVIDMIKVNGLSDTYNLVMNKLEAPSALGYSIAGEVIAVHENVQGYVVGDRVACGGASAVHADVVAIPVNLAVKVPEFVDLKQAAFTTIASIAIQGIRQADLKFGENCLIIGLGIVGQLTYKILESSGMRPIGIDVSQAQVDLCLAAGNKRVYNRNHAGIENIIMKYSHGHGVDAIIITAGTESVDPVELAGIVARKKAKVVIVGSVPTGFSRPNYYKKELDLRMSTSYGPGRLDQNYEDNGNDYPIGYVRWTENRNMQAYIDLLDSKRLDVSSLITHIYSLEDSPNAYDMILSRKKVFSGLLVEYSEEKELQGKIFLSDDSHSGGSATVGFIGAGSFAQGFLLPNAKGNCNLIGVSTARGNNSRYVGDKFGFKYCASSSDDIIADTKINTVFIATRHDLHAKNVIQCIEHNKHIYVEKPLALNESDLETIRASYIKARSNGSSNMLLVGFNRRFSPAVLELKKHFLPEQSKSIVIRVNSGKMPIDHWVNDPVIGGGRVIGEACHFIDLAMFLADSNITSITAEFMKDMHELNNTVVVNMKMANGSIASLNYFTNGNKSVKKESIEVFSDGTIAAIDDFKSVKVFGSKVSKINYRKQDKGHSTCVQLFLKAVKEGKPAPISFDEIYFSTLCTFKINQSIRENRKIIL